MASEYRADLAYIHDAGFGQLAQAAARSLIAELRRSGIHTGRVLDVGCGSGVSARLLRDAGYEVVGIDPSEPLLELARARVPEAEFRAGSVLTADLPACVAAVAIGEVLGYALADDEDGRLRDAVIARLRAALEPGGLLLFDVAGPERAPQGGPARTFTEREDWAVLMEAEADPVRPVLTRRITTFRRAGAHYRRDHEVHRLRLIETADMLASLADAGFAAEARAGYDGSLLPPGLTAFFARRSPDGSC